MRQNRDGTIIADDDIFSAAGILNLYAVSAAQANQDFEVQKVVGHSISTAERIRVDAISELKRSQERIA